MIIDLILDRRDDEITMQETGQTHRLTIGAKEFLLDGEEIVECEFCGVMEKCTLIPLQYNPKRFYDEVMEYGKIFGEIAFKIARAMDMGEEEDVKRELCNYITEQDYNPEICDYINSVNWL